MNWNYVSPHTNRSPLAKEYKKRLKLVRRACKSGTLIRPIAPIHFLRWAGIKGISCPDELVSLVPIYNSTESMKDSKDMSEVSEVDEFETADPSSPTAQEAAENTFDPLPITGIAEIFKLKANSDANSAEWILCGRQAQRNGLVDARVTTAKGHGKSTFDPEKVGVWLVNKGKMKQADVNRHLASNLPKRSKHLKDYYEQ